MKSVFAPPSKNAAIGLAHVAPDGHFLLVNDHLCQLLGYSRGELISRGFPEITHPDDLQEDWSLANSLLAGEHETYSVQERYLHRNGAVIWGAPHVRGLYCAPRKADLQTETASCTKRISAPL